MKTTDESVLSALDSIFEKTMKTKWFEESIKRNEKLIKENEILITEKERLQQEKETLKAESLLLNTQKRTLQIQNEELKKENEQSSIQFDKERVELHEMIEALTEEKNQVQQLTSALVKKNQELEESINRAEKRRIITDGLVVLLVGVSLYFYLISSHVQILGHYSP